MSLPDTISTKVSSEAAGYISITPVERREMPLVELLEQVLAVTGKKASRIREILKRGSLVRGVARYRWEPLEVREGELLALLDRFPDAQPRRPFDTAKCRRIILHGARGSLDLPYDVAAKRRFLKRSSFWDVMLATLAVHAPHYERYSYGDRADVYAVRELPFEAAQQLREERRLLWYSALSQQLQHLEISSAELFVER